LRLLLYDKGTYVLMQALYNTWQSMAKVGHPVLLRRTGRLLLPPPEGEGSQARILVGCKIASHFFSRKELRSTYPRLEVEGFPLEEALVDQPKPWSNECRYPLFF
jgi:hypothetical protein